MPQALASKKPEKQRVFACADGGLDPWFPLREWRFESSLRHSRQGKELHQTVILALLHARPVLLLLLRWRGTHKGCLRRFRSCAGLSGSRGPCGRRFAAGEWRGEAQLV